MKYLKPYKIFELSSRQDVLLTLQDISLDIQDMGFRVLIGEDPAIPSQFGGDEWNSKRRVLINIDKNTHGYRDIFYVSDIKDYLLRVYQFLESERFKPIIFIPANNRNSILDRVFVDKDGVFKYNHHTREPIEDYKISWVEIKAERMS